MAYTNVIDDLWNKKPQELNQNVSGSGSGVAQSSTPNGNSSASNTNKGSGSSWTNLQDYVTANEGQGSRMGLGIENNLAPTVTDANANLGAINTVLGEDITNGTHYADSNSDVIAPGSYSGPNTVNLAGDSDVSKSQKKLTDASTASASQGGQQQLLNNTYKAPQYTNAMQGLDAFLMNSGGGKDSLDRIGKLGTSYSDNVSTAQKGLESVIAGIPDKFKEGDAIQAYNVAAKDKAKLDAAEAAKHPGQHFDYRLNRWVSDATGTVNPPAASTPVSAVSAPTEVSAPTVANPSAPGTLAVNLDVPEVKQPYGTTVQVKKNVQYDWLGNPL
jgi:hypothetical protein